MAKKKLFLDLEFTGLHKLTTPISIGLVAEDGKEFYAEFTDFDEAQIDDFLSQHILTKRILTDYVFEEHYDPDANTVLVKGDMDLVKQTLTAWLENYKEDGVEIWGDVLAYDWVLFVSIFGNAFDVPSFVHYIPMDLATALKTFGEDPDVDRELYAYGEEKAKENEADAHNALHDARTQLAVYKKLLSKGKSKDDSKPEEEIEKPQEEADSTAPLATVVEGGVSKEDASAPESQEETIEEVTAPIAELIESEQEEIKEEVSEEPVEELSPENPQIEELPEVTSDVNSPNDGFIEPTQAMVNSSKEWDAPM
jgi:hypothetical protein